MKVVVAIGYRSLWIFGAGHKQRARLTDLVRPRGGNASGWVRGPSHPDVERKSGSDVVPSGDFFKISRFQVHKSRYGTDLETTQNLISVLSRLRTEDYGGDGRSGARGVADVVQMLKRLLAYVFT